MLYLIKSYGPRCRFLYKVGFTDNLEKRHANYYYNNPFYELISIREGDLYLETIIHLVLTSMNLQYQKLNEWFISSPEVLQIFHYRKEKLEKMVWRNRGFLFDMNSQSDYKLFKFLYEKYGNKGRFITEEYKVSSQKIVTETKALKVDIEFWKIYRKRDVLEEISPDSYYSKEGVEIVQDFLNKHFYKTGLFTEKMKLYCEFMDCYKGNSEIEEIISHKIQDNRFKTHYNFFGTAGCKSYSYFEADLRRRLMDATKEERLKRSIQNRFNVGEKYSKKEIKEALFTIYQDLGITSFKPKATDLENYFNLSGVLISDSTGKRSAGFKINSIK